MNVLDYLRKFDGYPKTLEEFRVRTAAGALSKLIFFKLFYLIVYLHCKLVHNKKQFKM